MDRKITVLAFLGLSLLSAVLPASAQSNLSDNYNKLFLLVTLVSAAVLLLVLVLWGYFMYTFRETNEDVERTPLSHSTARKLEVGWTFVAILIVVILMVVSFPVLSGETSTAEASDAGERIIVEGTGSWEWVYHLSNGSSIQPEIVGESSYTNITLEVGKLYTFEFYSSGGIIHSYYAPDLNIKMDVIPGMNNTYTFEITEEGEFPVLCAEFCGTGHSGMRGFIIAEA